MSAPVILSAAATKGGVGKTTLIANVSAVLADIGLRVLMIDCDVQPSLSKYYPISHRAPNGIVELLLGENTEEIIRSTMCSWSSLRYRSICCYMPALPNYARSFECP
ncbi:TPA: ParA family protein [Neisseria gonorrhoeae]